MPISGSPATRFRRLSLHQFTVALLPGPEPQLQAVGQGDRLPLEARQQPPLQFPRAGPLLAGHRGEQDAHGDAEGAAGADAPQKGRHQQAGAPAGIGLEGAEFPGHHRQRPVDVVAAVDHQVHEDAGAQLVWFTTRSKALF